MKLSIKITLFFLLYSLHSFSQAYDPYYQYASLSYGFYSQNYNKFIAWSQSNEFKSKFYNMHVSSINIIGPFSFKYEFTVSDKFSISPYVGYEKYDLYVQDSVSKSLVNQLQFTLNNLSVAVRGNYHFLNRKYIDVFIGGGFGANVYGYAKKINGEPYAETNQAGHSVIYREGKRFYYKPPVFASATLGVRIYITEYAGLNLEAGWEKSALLHAGIVIRIKEKN